MCMMAPKIYCLLHLFVLAPGAWNTSDGGPLSAPWASHPPEDLSGLPSLRDPGAARGCDWTEVPLCLHVSSPCRKRSGILELHRDRSFSFFFSFLRSHRVWFLRLALWPAQGCI